MSQKDGRRVGADQRPVRGEGEMDGSEQGVQGADPTVRGIQFSSIPEVLLSYMSFTLAANTNRSMTVLLQFCENG